MRRNRLVPLVAFMSFAFASIAFGKDVYLPAAGSAGVFHTDARIFNPSQTKDIQIQAWLLPVGNIDNSGVQPVTFTVPKRQMSIYNDVLTALFHASGLAGIRFSSADDFIATQRVYATSTTACSGAVNPCTLGQFLVGLDGSAAKKAGVILQLSSGATFRTNVGAQNPNGVAATTTWRVYDKNNAVVGSPKTIVMPPYSVIAPTGITGFGDSIPATADLSDAWVGYISDQPIVAYGSVVDNGSTDQTYVPAIEDSNPPSATTNTPPPGVTSFDVTISSFQIAISPDPSKLNVGDEVSFKIKVLDSGHGFTLVDDTGGTIIPDASGINGFAAGTTITRTFTVSKEGTFTYFCTHPTCGGGHNSMFGSFTVGQGGGDPPPRY